ncbi:hypothetical protein BH23DEI1_BH23DEI1_12210 [soil metagenome]
MTGGRRDERHRPPSGGPSEGVPAGAVRLGKLGRTYGLEGAQRIHGAGADENDALLRCTRLWVAGHGSLAVRMVKPHAGSLLIAFQGIKTPERAQELVNADVYAEAGTVDAAPLRRSVAALTGAVVRLDGAPYGTVVEVQSRAQLLLLVRGPAGERWLPGDAPYVRIGDGVVDVEDPPAGLLDDAP